MEEEDNILFNKIRTRTRLYSDDQANLKRIYKKYLNYRLKKTINWTCPICIRAVVDELITYQSNNIIGNGEKEA